MDCLKVGIREGEIIRGGVVGIGIEVAEQIRNIDQRVAPVGAAAVMEAYAGGRPSPSGESIRPSYFGSGRLTPWSGLMVFPVCSAKLI
ncbi:MAG: hypothetical protein L6W00_24875 [Lentisphaeria bacterium]|nr:MAG: hypothetical protein L6W00_24875 [Lentisphaeria bacterium]